MERLGKRRGGTVAFDAIPMAVAVAIRFAFFAGEHPRSLVESVNAVSIFEARHSGHGPQRGQLQESLDIFCGLERVIQMLLQECRASSYTQTQKERDGEIQQNSWP